MFCSYYSSATRTETDTEMRSVNHTGATHTKYVSGQSRLCRPLSETLRTGRLVRGHAVSDGGSVSRECDLERDLCRPSPRPPVQASSVEMEGAETKDQIYKESADCRSISC